MNEQQACSLLHVAYWIWTSQLSYQLVKFETVQYFYLHTQHVCKVKVVSHLSCTLPRQRQFGSACRKKSFLLLLLLLLLHSRTNLHALSSNLRKIIGASSNHNTRVFKPIVRLSLGHRQTFLTMAFFNATTLFLNTIAPLPQSFLNCKFNQNYCSH